MNNKQTLDSAQVGPGSRVKSITTKNESSTPPLRNGSSGAKVAGADTQNRNKRS